jgi:preprotein translocase subunit SecB
MTIKQSPLKLHQFFITRTEVDFSDPEEYENFNVEKEVEKYNIDIDFSIKRPLANIFNVFVRTDINKGESFAGYKISSECIGIFHLDEELPDDDVKRLINTSALVMTINYLRAHISNVTSPMPWGPYFIPSIDMQDLHTKKIDLIKRLRESKSGVKTAVAKKIASKKKK